MYWMAWARDLNTCRREWMGWAENEKRSTTKWLNKCIEEHLKCVTVCFFFFFPMINLKANISICLLCTYDSSKLQWYFIQFSQFLFRSFWQIKLIYLKLFGVTISHFLRLILISLNLKKKKKFFFALKFLAADNNGLLSIKIHYYYTYADIVMVFIVDLVFFFYCIF